MKTPLALTLGVSACLLASACALKAQVTLVPGGPAAVDASFELQPEARTAWAALRDLDPSLPADPLAPQLWADGLPSGSRAEATRAGLRVTVPAADPKGTLPGLKADADSWTLTVDRATLRKLASLSAWSQSPALDSLLPAPGAAITEGDFRELLEYLLGPRVSPEAARLLVDQSQVELTLVAPRPIRTAPGAVSVSGRSAVYRWSLVRAMTLTPPLQIRITF